MSAVYTKNQIRNLIDALCEEEGQNSEMFAEMMEDKYDMEYDSGPADELLKKMRKVLKDNITLLL